MSGNALQPSVIGDLQKDLHQIALQAASSPRPGPATAVIADLADALHEQVEVLAEVIGRPNPPLLPFFGRVEVESGEWVLPLTDALQALDEKLSHLLSSHPRTVDGEQRKRQGQIALGAIRSALTGAGRRLDSITEKAAARARLEARGARLLTFRVEQR